MSELGPKRGDLTRLTPAEITDQSSTGDYAQSMADELTPGQLRDKLADTVQKIEQSQVEIVMLQGKVSELSWLHGEINRAIQLASDSNPGV